MAEAAVRSAGTLMGAVLESVGYHYQSYLLDALRHPLENEVGGLIYLVGVLLAVTYTATQGGYKLTGWLLIGPPLFFAALLREPIPNAVWEYGKQGRPQELVNEGIDKIIPAGAQANVSKLFGRYVQMVSSTIKEIVHRMSQGRENADLQFTVKAQLYGMMHTMHVDDIGFRRVMHRGLFFECQDVVTAAQEANAQTFAMNEGGAASLSDDQVAQQYASTRANGQKKYDQLYNVKRIKLDQDIDAVRWIAGKTNQTEQKVKETVYSCNDLWQLIYQGLLDNARRMLMRIDNLSEENGVPKQVTHEVIGQGERLKSDAPVVNPAQPPAAFSSEQTQRLVRIIAKYLLRNEDGQQDKGSLIGWFATRHEGRVMKTKSQRLNAFTERARIEVREWAERTRMMHIASSLPYYQGLALYFLGIGYPFFALLLLVPGKYGGFVLWFSLWLWVKSWDIGFAVVMLMDDLMFAMLSLENQDKHVRELEPDLQLAMTGLHQMDPTFQMATYYTLIGCCMMSVPPVMAQLILGTVGSGTSLVMDSVRGWGEHFFQAQNAQDMRSAGIQARWRMSENRRKAMEGYRANMEKGRPYDEGLGLGRAGMGNSLSGIQSFEHSLMEAANGNTRPATYLGMQRIEPTDEGVKRARALAAGLRGAQSTGLAEGFNPTGVKQDDDSMITGALNALTASRFVDKAQAANAISVINAEMNAVTAMAAWEQEFREEQTELWEEVGVTGSLPLPWTTFTDEPSDKEYAVAEAHFQNWGAIQKAEWEMNTVMVEEMLKAGQTVFKQKFESLRDLRQQLNAAPNRRTEVMQAFVARMDSLSSSLTTGGGAQLRSAINTGVAAIGAGGTHGMYFWDAYQRQRERLEGVVGDLPGPTAEP